ncbi:MAG TPA: hypothetical protein VE954_13415 [Oligoflexus sp.]|uniref:hypothetical protein n=1 Tax=Oligoflexus sp. TaxID=1971216 RepID=UPI002D220F8F|nr:hypothetical protein [Oligoflexus sp.]HYX34103.1 hypothetical protein [Oligoflexus sp.]
MGSFPPFQVQNFKSIIIKQVIAGNRSQPFPGFPDVLLLFILVVARHKHKKDNSFCATAVEQIIEVRFAVVVPKVVYRIPEFEESVTKIFIAWHPIAMRPEVLSSTNKLSDLTLRRL